MRVPRRRLPLFALPVLLVAAWGWWSGTASVRSARRELDSLEAHRAALQQTNRDLERQVRALKGEREARERAARETLDAAAPGELVVVLPTPTPTPTPAPTPATPDP